MSKLSSSLKHLEKQIKKRKYLLTAISVLALGAIFYVGVILASNVSVIYNDTFNFNNPISSVPSLQFDVSADNSATIPIYQYRLYSLEDSNGSTWKDCTCSNCNSTSTATMSCGSGAANIEGELVMQVRVEDSDGATDETQTNPFLIDNSAPNVSLDDIVTVTGDTTKNTDVDFTGTITENTKINITDVSWTGTWDEVGGSCATTTTVSSDPTIVDFICNPGTIPESAPGTSHVITISATNETGYTGDNNYTFSVDSEPPTGLSMTGPGATEFNAGYEYTHTNTFNQRTMTISWDSGLTDAFSLGSDPVYVYFHADGATSTPPSDTIATQKPASPNSVEWIIPDIDTTSGVIEIMAEDMAENTISVYSNPITIHSYSPPTVVIDNISNTNSSPVNLTASVTGIDSPETIVSTQSSGGSCTVTVTSPSTADLDCGTYSPSSQGTQNVYVSILDSNGDGDYDTESFTYDTSAPSVNAGILGTINLATKPGASASDTYTSVASYSWSDVSGPGNISFNNATSTLNPYISANTYSSSSPYTARLTACDSVGNCASDTVDFIWTDQPISGNFNIVEPSGGERLAGGNNFTIEWTSPGGAALDNFDIEYSLNGGSTWSDVTLNLVSTATTYNWSIPYDNSENVQVRVIAQDNTNSDLLTETSSTFIIDSTPPTVDAGDLPNIGEDPAMMSVATAPMATSTDNFDTDSQLSYDWDVVLSPGGADVYFGGTLNNSSVVNPDIEGTVTGSYTVRLTVTDRAGNEASDTVEFNWDGYPPDFSIIYPAGGETFAGGDNIAIEWAESSSAVEYDIYYSTDNWVSSSSIVLGTIGLTTGSNLYYDWTVPTIDSETVQVRVVGIDSFGNEGIVTSDTFGIDSTDPIVDAGMYYNVVLGPTQPGASSSDIWSGIETYSWTQDSGSGTLEFTDGASNPAADTANPFIYADVPGVYVARLTVTDKAGNSAFDTVALITNTNPPTAVITAPGKDVHWKGGTTKNIQWNLNTDPGNLTDFNVDYSIDGGSTWQPASSTMSTVASSSMSEPLEWSMPWSVPMENSTSSVMRVITNNTEGETATATQEFVIDSEAPVITPGTLASTTEATTTKTVIVDNIDSQSEVTYLWSLVTAPSGGQIVFSPSHTVMDPEISGTVTGNYIIQVISQDQAGNLSTAYIGNEGNEFYWDGDPGVITVTSPSSTTIIPGDINYTIEWYLEDPGDLTTFDIDYSLDGNSWNNIATGVSSTSREYLWSVPAGLNSTSSVVRVTANDIDTNTSIGTSANFTIDSTAPVVDTGTMPTPISSASSSEGVTTIDNFDSLEYLDNQWTELSLPYSKAILTIASSTDLETEFAGDMSGWYEVLLTSTDRAGNVGTSSLSFYWMSEYDPYITYPTEGVHLPGGETSTATWELFNSGDLSHIEAHYSVDGGDSWTLVGDNIASTSLEVDWQVPDSTNSTSSLFRMYTVDNLGRHATATSQLFTIDSDDPYVDAGSYSDYLNNAASPGASSSDNLTAFDDLNFSWSKVSGVGDINFSDRSALNPSISATRNGDYVARLTVTDKAGNTSSDTVSFERKISSGGGGGGVSYCTSVEYGPWEDCIDGIQHREIINYDPGFCTPTSAQLDAEERSCTALETCSSVSYSDWGSCINGYQTRTVLNRNPENCVLSEAQDTSLTQTCDSEDNNQDDPNQVMEDARANVGEIDQSLVERLKGQILIQVEDLGRAWYVNVDDGARYYLGRPRNAFTVMSMIGKGIKNELLKKLPVGLLDPKLSNDSDSDGDGLTDRLEEGLETDFFNSDSDGDGFTDYEEITNGYDPLNANATKSIIDNNLLQANLGQIFIQVETNGEAWYVEPKTEKRYYLGRPLEAFNIMRQFGVGITNEDINKIPVGEFSEEQKQKITNMLEQRKRELEAVE